MTHKEKIKLQELRDKETLSEEEVKLLGELELKEIQESENIDTIIID
jgi:hypothetical protein